jgi:hypothetical protein
MAEKPGAVRAREHPHQTTIAARAKHRQINEQKKEGSRPHRGADRGIKKKKDRGEPTTRKKN